MPRQQLERVEVRLGQDVGLLDAAEAVDRAAVEGHPLVEGVLELGGGDVERLVAPEDVGEPQLDEPDPALLDDVEDVGRLLLGHGSHCRRSAAAAIGAAAARQRRLAARFAGARRVGDFVAVRAAARFAGALTARAATGPLAAFFAPDAAEQTVSTIRRLTT